MGRSQPGYWSADEDNSSPEPCDVPSQERCVGWSTTLGSTLCGVGYLQNSSRCASCTLGYYSVLGVFSPCPSGKKQYTPLLTFVGVVLGTLVVVLVIVVLLMRRIGGTVKGGVTRYVSLTRTDVCRFCTT